MVTITNEKDEEFLRNHTEPVDIEKLKKDPDIQKKFKNLIKEMREFMKQADGVGLSANQIGLTHRLFVAQVPDNQGKPKFYAVLNPEITKKSEEMETVEEGCLSVPGKFGPTERHYEVTLTGFDPRGKKLKIKAWGLLARVFQHEVDHLNGKLFIDRASEVLTLEELQEKGSA